MEGKTLALICSFLILGQAVLVRAYVGTWMVPACLFSLFWFVYTVFPLGVLFTVPIEPVAVGYILLCCVAFSISVVGFDWKESLRKNRSLRECRGSYDTPFLRAVFWVCTIAALASVFMDAHVQGFSIGDLFLHIMETARKYISLRYADALEPNVFRTVVAVMVYPVAVFGGLVFGDTVDRRRKAQVLVAAMLPSIAVMLLQGAKGTLFQAIPLFWASTLVCKLRRGDGSIITGRGARSMVRYSVVIAALIVVAFVSRSVDEIDDPDAMRHQLLRGVASYSCGHLYAFSDWFAYRTTGISELGYADEEAYTFGFQTFMAPFRLLGDERWVPAGYYDEYFSYGDFLQTNIFTMFRGTIMDFGIVGGVVFFFIAGLALHVCFRGMLVRKDAVAMTTVFVLGVAAFYSSFMISLFIWNSPYLLFGTVAGVLAMNGRLYGDMRGAMRGNGCDGLRSVSVIVG